MSFTYNDVSVLSPLKASGAKVRISLLLKSLQKKKIKINYDLCTVFENHRKSLIELLLHFEWPKSSLKTPKMVHFGEFLKSFILRSNSVTRQVTFNLTKIGGKCKNSKIEMRYFFGQNFIINAKISQFWRVFENLKLAVKQCYQTGHF